MNVSDVSVLSQEYETASELSRALNRALITIKKKQLGLPGGEAIAPKDLDQSRKCLIATVEALLRLVRPAEPKAPGAVSEAAARVPGALVSRIRSIHQGDLAYYLEDLEGLVGTLKHRTPSLSSKELCLLEELAGLADAEASNVFRRLMRT